MRGYLTAVVYWIGRCAVAIMGVLGFLIAVSDFVTDLLWRLLDWGLTEMANLEAPSFEFNVTDYQNTLALANHFLPVSEAWSFLVATIPYLLFVIILRFVKSWIPGISG